jgi:hypothetical protein
LARKNPDRLSAHRKTDSSILGSNGDLLAKPALARGSVEFLIEKFSEAGFRFPRSCSKITGAGQAARSAVMLMRAS